MLATLALSVLIVSCADVVQDQREPIAANAVSAARACRDPITLAGRFSAQYRKDGKDEAVHGSFQWKQSGNNENLTLLSPLGQTVATIEITPSAATLTSAGQPQRTAADADALVVASLGWPLPVSGLGHWLQGCALDAQGHLFVANSGRNKVTTSDGWHIEYPLWEDAAEVDAGTARRPKRIDLKRAGDGAAAEIVLRLVIDTWQPDGNKNGNKNGK